MLSILAHLQVTGLPAVGTCFSKGSLIAYTANAQEMAQYTNFEPHLHWEIRGPSTLTGLADNQLNDGYDAGAPGYYEPSDAWDLRQPQWLDWNPVQGFIESKQAPAAPTSLQVLATNATSVEIGWQDNSANETSFRVERKIAFGSWVEVATIASNVTYYWDTGLSGGTLYRYRVRAWNSTGYSPYSNEVSVTTPLNSPPPAAPRNLTMRSVSNNQITIGWTDASSNETGFFVVQRRTGVGGTWSQVGSLGANVTTCTNTGLSPATTYDFRVQAFNAYGFSACSNVTYGTTPATVTYSSNRPPGTYTTGGNVLKMTATFSGSIITFTVRKIDGSPFSTSGVMTIRVGSYNGCVAFNNTLFWNYAGGTYSTSRTVDLATYFTSGSKDFYGAIGKPAVYCSSTPPTYYTGKITVTAN